MSNKLPLDKYRQINDCPRVLGLSAKYGTNLTIQCTYNQRLTTMQLIA